MGVDINNNTTMLTKKPQSRNDMAAAEAMHNGDKNKASNLNVSSFNFFNLFIFNYFS